MNQLKQALGLPSAIAIVMGSMIGSGIFIVPADIARGERRRWHDVPRPYKALGYPVLPAVYIFMAVFIDLVLLKYKPQYTWPGLIIVCTGIPVYYLWKNTRKELK